MKTKLLIAGFLLAPTLALFAEDKPSTPPPAPPPVVEPVADDAAIMQKKILRKLDDIDVRLTRIETALKSSGTSDRKIDSIERDVGDIRRSVQRLESKR